MALKVACGVSNDGHMHFHLQHADFRALVSCACAVAKAIAGFALPNAKRASGSTYACQ